jgi:hypothetical protein
LETGAKNVNVKRKRGNRRNGMTRNWETVKENKAHEIFAQTHGINTDVTIENGNIKEIVLFGDTNQPIRITSAWESVRVHTPKPPTMVTKYKLEGSLLGKDISEIFEDRYDADRRANEINNGLINPVDFKIEEIQVPEE